MTAFAPVAIAGNGGNGGKARAARAIGGESGRSELGTLGQIMGIAAAHPLTHALAPRDGFEAMYCAAGVLESLEHGALTEHPEHVLRYPAKPAKGIARRRSSGRRCHCH